LHVMGASFLVRRSFYQEWTNRWRQGIHSYFLCYCRWNVSDQFDFFFLDIVEIFV
jgi:hypothetical protein